MYSTKDGMTEDSESEIALDAAMDAAMDAGSPGSSDDEPDAPSPREEVSFQPLRSKSLTLILGVFSPLRS